MAKANELTFGDHGLELLISEYLTELPRHFPDVLNLLMLHTQHKLQSFVCLIATISLQTLILNAHAYRYFAPAFLIKDRKHFAEVNFWILVLVFPYHFVPTIHSSGQSG